MDSAHGWGRFGGTDVHIQPLLPLRNGQASRSSYRYPALLFWEVSHRKLHHLLLCEFVLRLVSSVFVQGLSFEGMETKSHRSCPGPYVLRIVTKAIYDALQERDLVMMKR